MSADRRHDADPGEAPERMPIRASAVDAQPEKSVAPPPLRPRSRWIDRVLERSAPRPPRVAPPAPSAGSAGPALHEGDRPEPRPSPLQTAPRQAVLAATQPAPLPRADIEGERPEPPRPAHHAIEPSPPLRPPDGPRSPFEARRRREASPEPTLPTPSPSPATAEAESTTHHRATQAQPPARTDAPHSRDAIEAQPKPMPSSASMARPLASPRRDPADATHAPRDDRPPRLDPPTAIAELAPALHADAAPTRAAPPPPAQLHIGRVTVEITPSPAVAPAAGRSPVAARAQRLARGNGTRPSSLRFGLGSS
jgi:hypothetical protein